MAVLFFCSELDLDSSGKSCILISRALAPPSPPLALEGSTYLEPSVETRLLFDDITERDFVTPRLAQ